MDHQKFQTRIVAAYNADEPLKLFKAMAEYNMILVLEEASGAPFIDEYRKEFIQKKEYIIKALSSEEVGRYIRFGDDETGKNRSQETYETSSS